MLPSVVDASSAGLGEPLTGHRGQRVLDALDRPLVIAAVSGVAMLLFVVARLVAVGEGDLSSFAVVGESYADPVATEDVRVVDGTGYDGQFAYRLALDPADLEGDRNGVEVDSPLRWGRIAYPSLAWVTSMGQAGLVPAALVGVNVAGAALLGWLAALEARRHALHAAAGLLVVGWAGFVFTVARDLTEVVAAVGVVGGLVAWHRQRAGWSAGALSVAVLAREGTVVVLAALAVVRLVGWVRGRWRPGVLDLSWLVPAAVFVSWQGWCVVVTGEVPVLTSVGEHVGAPTVGAGVEQGWLGEADWRLSVLKGAQSAALVATVAVALLAARRRRVDPVVVVALALAVVVVARVWAPVWNDWAGFRALTDVYVLAAMGALAGRRHLVPLGLAVAPVWAASALQMTVAL